MSRRQRFAAVLLATLAAGALAGGTAQVSASTAPAGQVSATDYQAHLPKVIKYRAPSQYPEGVAWDPTRGAFLVGSAVFGTVSIVRPNGTVRPLVGDHGLVTTLGLTVDVARNRLLVAYADVGPNNTVSGLGIFNLTTGKPIHLVNLKLGTGPQAANDVTVDPLGNAYVTDTLGDVIYRVNTSGRVTATITDPRFTSTGFGVNGIVWHPMGYLLVGRFDTGRLFRVTPNGTVREVMLDKPIPGADGLALRPDGKLVVVTNSLGGAGVDAARILRPNHTWTQARQVDVTPWPDPVPTTVALTPSGAYLISGRLDRLLAGDLSVDTFTLRRA